MRRIIGCIGLCACVATAAFMPKFQSAGKVKCNGANITGITFATMFVADWDGDGKKDLFVGEFNPNNKVRLYTNVGTNSAPVFNTFQYLQAAGQDIQFPGSWCAGATNPRVEDIDGDGYKDFIIGARDGFIYFFKRTSDGKLNAKVQMKTKAGASMKSSSGSNSAPVVYDWNNDGLLDILTGAEGSLPDNPKAPLLFKNIGTKTKPEFADPVPMTADNTQIVDAERYNIDVADLNYDGKHDFLIGAGWSPSCVYFYENTGTKENPVLKKKVTLQDKSGATIKFHLDLKVYVTDWNEDGGLDLLLGHLDGPDGIDIYLGDVPPTGVINPGSTAGPYLIQGTIENSFYRTNVHLIEPDRVLLQVFSTNGRVIGSTPVGNLPAGTSYIRYNMGEYPAGSYFINIIAGEKSIGQDPVILLK